MLHIVHSNSLPVLKDILLNIMQKQPLPDPFSTEKILVQSPGMAQWLKLELATDFGIVAAVDFPLPASFLWDCFAAILTGVPARSAFSKEAMSWKLMQCLPELLPKTGFEPLQSYLDRDDGDFRLYQLCQNISDIYDQYLVYRPDWIEDWEKGGNKAAKNQPWQPVLWRRLVEYTQQLEQPHWHRTNMYKALITAIAHADIESVLPKRFFVFGISALPESYIRILEVLGQHIDIYMLVNNPCRLYWGDIKDPKYDLDIIANGNPLLASMGKLGRDYLSQLLEISNKKDIDAFVVPEGKHLLAQIQQDILDLREPDVWQDSVEELEPDQSIKLHSCHSPLRELEVLQDQLLAMFDNDPTLSPSDIIVMLPDVASYAAYIDAVFSNAPIERHIPYSISDQNSRQESPLILSFETILKLNMSRFTVSEVVSLLEVPAIMRRFELEKSDFQKLKSWIEQANIRWGLDEEQRGLQQIPAFGQNSWRQGLERMLAGYALGDSVGLWQGIAPFCEIEGKEAELLGKLINFIECLEAVAIELNQDWLIAEWIEKINQLLDRLYQADSQDEVFLNIIRQNLQTLQQQLKDADYKQPLSAMVVTDYLIQGISYQSSAQRFMVGAINFCTLMPMRSIPFRVVCLLGMNDKDYPRIQTPVRFDLMTKYYRIGDRSRRDDDRYLFLEALLAAGEIFYISFVGRSIRDNHLKEPSILVSELLDYIQQRYTKLFAPEQLDSNKKSFQQHALVPFSPIYFQSPDSNIFSYASEWLPAAGSQVAMLNATPFYTKPIAQLELETLGINQLIQFFKNPCKAFFEKRLKIYFRQFEPDIDDEEPFKLDSLQNYKLKHRCLEAMLDAEDDTKLTEILLAEGQLPVFAAGEQLIEDINQEVRGVVKKIKHYAEGEPDRLNIQIQLKQVKLEGWLEPCYKQLLLRYQPVKARARHYLASWIEHLIFCIAQKKQGKTIYIGLSGDVCFSAISSTEALEYLQTLVDIYYSGMAAPLAFDAELAKEYCNNYDEEAIRQKYYGTGYSRGAADDPYIYRAYPDADLFTKDFFVLAEAIYAPLLQYIEELK